MDKMHINMVTAKGICVKYNIEVVNGEMQVVARFVKDGKEIYKIHKVNDQGEGGVSFIAKLLDREYAIKMAIEMIENFNLEEKAKADVIIKCGLKLEQEQNFGL